MELQVCTMPEVEKQFKPNALDTKSMEAVADAVRAISILEPSCQHSHYYKLATEAGEKTSPNESGNREMKLAVCYALLGDLSDQGWTIFERDGAIVVKQVSHSVVRGEDTAKVKSVVRKGLQRHSNRQLAEPTVQAFLKSMERPRQYKGREVSIRNLIDDGSELASILTEINGCDPSERSERLGRCFKPVIEECGSEDRCDITGLKLQDIWRYFRHTWSLQYNPLPGRTLRLIVRNAARPNKPIIGITMLASPAANLYSRDEWIGWQLKDLIEGLSEKRWDAKIVCRALFDAIEESIDAIRFDDLIASEERNTPTPQTFFKLEQIVSRAKSSRQTDLTNDDKQGLVDIRCIDKADIEDAEWLALSSTSLFVKKRAEQLLPLLRARQYFCEKQYSKAPAAVLYEALVEKRGSKMVQIALNEIKKRKLASEVADIAVCGAVTPYNDLLAGKLVTLLMCSREAVKIYRDRYANQPSEISSQIAGRRIVRPSQLKVLTTTSLYGVGSSQYNRLALKKGDRTHLDHDIIWNELKPSEGFTVTHISLLTVNLMRKLSVAHYGRRRINSVFGEGSSPRTRQIREGLNLIGINNDDLLRQSVGRRVYACELVESGRDYLLGFSKQRRAAKPASASKISSAWIERWLDQRIQSSEILERVSAKGPETVVSSLRLRAGDHILAIEEPKSAVV
jgi:Domain of unknown function (DUF4338)